MKSSAKFDVFVSYNTVDSAVVEYIAGELRERGLTVFLDRGGLVPGRPWPEALEEHLGCCRSAAVILGPSGMGSWQQREHYLALDRQARDHSFLVIPVILPSADPALGFLSLNTWVDLRGGVYDAESMDLLAAAVRGKPPSALLQGRIQRALDEVCPYRGLEFFREEDAPSFFGREAFTKELCAKVAAQSLVAVVGCSGSGKSSVVRAGLVPNLRQPNGKTVWEVVTLAPGDRPFYAISSALMPLLDPQLSELKRLRDIREMANDLARAKLDLRDVVDRVLEKQPGTDRLLLVIDQWEELYTQRTHDEQAEDERKRKRTVTRFTNEVLAATKAAPVTLVLTLRADFYSEALSHRGLSDRLQIAQVNLGPMSRGELERAVTKPADKGRLRFDNGLVDRLLDDVGEEPGNLPLMEFALKALWDARHGNRLLYDVYKAMGGVKGAIAERAEAIYKQLGADQQEVVQKVFTMLVRPGKETGDTRRRARLNEFDDVGRNIVHTLAGKDARLLVTGRDAQANHETVEIAHEALLREWPRLKKWISEQHDALRQRDKLLEEARIWVSEKRPPAHKWKHELLDRARRLLTEAGLLVAMEREPDIADFLIPEAEWLLAELLCSGTDHVRREAIGMRLSEIGDPRLGVGVIDGVPDILWCDIPAGEVELEGRGRFEVASFRMSAYPVTFAQYKAFFDAEDGYLYDLWWDGLGRKEKPGKQLRPYGNYPANYISWYEATAFCRWMSKKLDLKIDIPDEWEWQWAAQSAKKDFTYPWGTDWQNGLANTHEARVGSMTAVGMYPGGCSLQGVYDLSGNVWEWCRSRFDAPKGDRIDTDETLAIRGGSWSEQRNDARARNRRNAGPHAHEGALGFRVVCELPAPDN